MRYRPFAVRRPFWACWPSGLRKSSKQASLRPVMPAPTAVRIRPASVNQSHGWRLL